MTAPALTLPEQHALELRDAGWIVDEVIEVFPPFDSGEPAEVLFRGRKNRWQPAGCFTGWCAPDEKPRVVEGW